MRPKPKYRPSSFNVQVLLTMSFDYKGFVLPIRKAEASIPRLDVSSVDAETFFKDHVAKRRPAILCGLPEDLQTLQTWSNSALRKAAGSSTIAVEVKGGTRGATGFGQGVKEKMTFDRFLTRVDAGDESMYLTTQDLATNSLGQQELMASPLREIRAKNVNDLPLCPTLMGNLVLSTMNIWMGNSKDGTSTGLHHDYHDNLYILLRGRKTFRLFSPADTSLMYTRGEIAKVHPNGRINYEGFATRADGSDSMMERQLKLAVAKMSAEENLEKAEAALARGEKGAQARVDEAEEALDAAMDALLPKGAKGANSLFTAPPDTDVDEKELAMGVNGDDDDDYEEVDWANLRDDYQDSDAEEGDSDDGEAGEDDDEDEEGDALDARPSKRQRSEGSVDESDPTQTPLNFSMVNDPDAPDKSKFPLFLRATPAKVSINAGEMLYLPCGWFHEVTSATDDHEKEDFPGHLAVNYWFHPPTTAKFSSPYEHDHWKKDWELRFPQSK